MAYSTQRALSDGTLREILLTIGFIDRVDVNVYVDNVLLTEAGTTPPSDITYEWITDNLIRFSEDIPDGSEVLIQRATELGTVLNVFSAGASFDDPTMDENFLQLLYIAQEAREGADLAEVFQDIDMHGYQLNNLGPATEPGHAVPLQQMQDESTWAYQSRVAAEAAAATAVSARNAAQLSESNAAGSAAAAAGSASAANTSAVNAAASAATAITNRNEALNFRNEAKGFRDEAEGFRDDAENSALEAAGYAAGVNLPSALGHGGEYLRQRVDESGFEYRTRAQTRGDLGLDSLPVSVWEFANLITDKPVADDPSTWDWTPAFNGAIAAAAMSGGGVVTHTPGTYKILGTIYLVTRVVLELYGVNLVGSGSNTVFETGWLNGESTQSNVGEYGTGHTGNGTHYLQDCIVRGAKIYNCAVGARLHRFNYGCVIENCDIAAAEYSIFSTHGWSQQYRNNLLRRTMRLQDFVDWTIVEGNSFESIFNGPGLVIGQDQSGGEATYGGSWTLTIRNNGFHGCLVGILIRVEVENCLIQSNHFENGGTLSAPTIRHIYAPTLLTSRCFVIENNHLTATRPNVIAIEFAALRDSVIGKNDFVVSGGGEFAKRVVLSTASTFGNEVEVPYSPTGAAPDLSLYSLANTNILRVRGGSNNSALNQPYSEEWSGSGQYTFEKYRAKYRRVSNQIPFCTVSSAAANTIIVDTFVDSPLPFGPTFPVLFSFNAGGATDTHNITGFVIGTSVTLLGNRRLGGESGVANIAASVVAGKLRLTISDLIDSANSVTGWVKEM